MTIRRSLLPLLLTAGLLPQQLHAEYTIDYSAEMIATAGGGDFAPYYLSANNHGIITQTDNALIRAGVSHGWDESKRFSYGFGLDIVGGYSSSTDYLRYNNGSLVTNTQHPANAWIQQLYGEIKYRSLFLTIGSKEHGSTIVDNRLSSGDLVESGNSRPIPEVRVGFIDFQDIPFTNGWVQIQGELSYGKFTDSQWLKNHFNYYEYHLNLGALYSYKRCYFRTKPSMPLSVTVGMEVGAQFGGTSTFYTEGVEQSADTYSRGWKQFYKMLFPRDGGVSYYAGSSLGAWCAAFRYRLRNGNTVRAYFEKPFEDGSGIGFLNGFDGLWGVEYRTNSKNIVSGVVAEYLDFTNQSGPMHYDPDDRPNTNLTHRAEGGDSYYDNSQYNSYAHYGLSIGTPFLVAPLYNTDGSLLYLHSRTRGFHIGVEGNIGNSVEYRVLGGYRRSYGSSFFPSLQPDDDTSFMAEAKWETPVKGLAVKGQFAIDRGSLLGDNTGGAITVTYRGALAF